MTKYKYAKRMNDSEPSIIRELLKKSIEPDFISFAGGDPDPAFFPVDELMDFEHNDAVRGNDLLFQYGISEGNHILKDELIKYMKGMGINTAENELLITSGSQQGLDLTGKLFIDEGDIVIVERPGYMGAINAFNLYAPEFAGVGMNDDGMDMDELETILQSGTIPKFIYTVPDFQNPTGITMSLANRKRLLVLADEYDFLIVEDSPYYKLRFEGESIPTLKSMDTSDRVIYLGSFSKSVCPGLRIGWICANEQLIRDYVILKQSTDINTSELSQLQVVSFLKHANMNSYLKKLNRAYKKKKDSILGALQDALPESVKMTKPQGGLFVWLTLPSHIDAYKIMDRCLEQKVAVIPGTRFYVSDPQNNTIRLSYATMDEAKMHKGVEILSQIIKQY